MNAPVLTRRSTLSGMASVTLLSACGERRTSERKDVIVVGAGISGLYAAMLLEELGFDTLVLEASDRVGGRMLTLDQLDGSPEAGGQSVGSKYARVFSLAEQLGLEVFERKPFIPGSAYFIRGSLMGADDWESHIANTLSGPEREILPNRLYSHYVKQVNPITDLFNWREDDFYADDQVSIADRMRSVGASDEALRLMERWFDGGGLDNMSALFAYRKHLAAQFERPNAYRIKGGSARLPEAMAASLKTPVRFNAPIVSLSDNGSLVTVTDRNGNVYEAPSVFVSIPFSVLRDVAIDPAPSPALQAAIDTLPYNHITQVKVAFREPFWEADSLPPAMYADSFVERITAAPGQDGALHYLNVWIKGLQAQEFDQWDETTIGARVVAELERIRPSARGKISAAHVMAWGRNPHAKGAYHFFGHPGRTLYGDALLKPHGRVSWIGEHAAEFQQGMEGACASAEREVFAMVDRV